MQIYADLEIGLGQPWGERPQTERERAQAGKVAVDFRFHLPESETDVRSAKALVEIDPASLQPGRELHATAPGSAAYGKALTAALFQDPELRERFAEALAVARQQGLGVRLRLAIDPRAEGLHNLAWETLQNPQDGSPLSTGENLVFSRYLSSPDWRPVPLRHKDRMRALAVIANPSNLDEFNLAPVDAPGEAERLRQALGGLPVTILSRQAGEEPATPENLFRALHQRKANGAAAFDIVWLVCHGSLLDGEPWLWLEDDTGRAKRMAGSELLARLRELAEVPVLVVLASCESATGSAAGALSALGPRLSQAGVPAVVAMQGKISLQTSAVFSAAFFKSLQEEGVVDYAMNVARSQVRDRPDAWMPALFMRLRSGRIWYLPGFGGKEGDLDTWESLHTFLQEGLFTAILGPELANTLLGAPRDLARLWAERHGYPFSAGEREKFPQVAQYVSVKQNVTYLRIEYQKALREALCIRFPQALGQNLLASERWKPDDLLRALGFAAHTLWPGEAENPYCLLAKLGLKIYITSEQGDLLKDALIATGREPQVRLCPWNEAVRTRQALWHYDDEPTPEKPLIYHLFGHFKEPASLVFTEDDIYDYLIGLSQHRDLIPDSVSAALAASALIFLGFEMEDWQFRVFFRLVLSQPGVGGLEEFSHVAAQLAPREGLIEDAEQARLYIQKYFEKKRIDLYWGTSEEFLNELVSKLGL